MNKEELKQEAEQDAGNVSGLSLSTTIMVSKDKTDAYRLGRFDGYLLGAEPREKRISELEEKISVLLSCKNCPENKGGFICQKEYEDKCLAQKIQYIKELKEENKVLAQNLEDTEILNKTYEKRFDDLKKENAELRNNGFTVSAMTEQQLKVALEKGEQLEKENAELKTDYEVLSCSVGDFGELQDKLEEEQRKNNELSDNLTNAKEIIKEFMKYEINEYDGSLEIHFEELKKQAEQFLNSEVEK